MEKFFYFLGAAILFLAACFGVYKLTGSGEFMDWVIGSLSFLWLIFIITIPWNSYFKAKEIIYEAEVSKMKNIEIKQEGVDFAKRVSKRSLIVSISLHIFSAVGLFYIAYNGISQVGYYTALLTILLTFLRPGIRFYEYIHSRLEIIRGEFRYPREDVYELVNNVNNLISRMEAIENDLSTDETQHSWKNEVNHKFNSILASLEKLGSKLDNTIRSQKETKLDLEKVISTEIESIRKESKDLVSKIIEHGEVVDSLSTITKFLKKLN